MTETLNDLTAEYVRERLDYDSKSGAFYWKPISVSNHRNEIWNNRFVGKMAGSVTANGYLRADISSRHYLLHRIAWLYYYGEWPEKQIDHRDGNKTNNAISNLRPATHAENQCNSGRPNTNTSGFKGVMRAWRGNGWRAQIRTLGKVRTLGYFKTPEEAHAAYCAAAKKHHGEFARTE